MIHISAFALTGTADFSSIQTELRNLERTISNLRVPPIKTDVATPDFSKVVSAAKNAEKQATIKIKPEVDNSFGSGLSGVFSGQKGNFTNVGKELGSSLTMGMQQQFGMLGGMASSVATALGPVGIAAGVAGAGIIALGAASVGTAKEWQSMMASISKTTGIEGAELDQLSSTLQSIRMQTGATAEAISGAVITAGSIGIPKEELASFAQLALQMSSAFGMSSDAAAMAMGQIGNVAKPAEMSWTEFTTRAGSSVNVLADSMATSEEQILTGMKHLGATMGLLKPPVDTLDDWMALVATVQSLGLAGDSAGEAVQDAMQYATKDAKNAVSGLLGISAQELQLNLRTNAPEVLMDAAKAIAALPLDEQGAALAAFGQTGQKAISLLMGDLDGVTGQFALMGKAIDSSSDAWAEGTSLSIAYAKSQATLDAALSKLSASLDVTGQKIGTTLLPMLTSVVEALNAGVVAANEFASTTLPAWAQSTTNWINQALGMEEDTPEQIAERKAKIARTAEKTTTKTTDTTGYQSFSEAQASAAQIGQGAGNSYVDGLNAALGKGVPKALTDAYLGNALKTAKGAAAKAGALTGEDWVKAFASSASVGMSYGADYYNTRTKQWEKGSGQWFGGAERESFYKDKSLDYGKYSTFANGEVAWNLLKESASGKSHTMKAVISLDGTEYVREFSTLEDNMESAAKKIKAEFRDVAIDTSKYFKKYGGDIGDALSDALSDGVISFTEKDELGGYIESLEAMKIEFPVEFNQANLDDQLTKLKATELGLNVDLILGTDHLESDFYKWAEKNADVIATYLKNNTSYMEATEGRPEYEWLELNPDAVSLMEDYNAALSSNDPKKISQLPGLQKDLMRLHPELQDQAFWTTKVNVAQAELNEHFAVLDGTVYALDETGKIVTEDFRAEIPVLAAHGTGLIEDSKATADHTRALLSSIESITNIQYAKLPTPSKGGTVGKADITKYAPLENLTLPKFAKGGFSDKPTVMFGEAGEEAYVPISDRAAGLEILPEVLRKLGVKMAAKGLVMGDSLASWGSQPHASSTVSSNEYDYYGSLLADKCASGCELGIFKATSDWLESPDVLGDFNDGLQKMSLSSNTAASANYKLAGSATYVSSRWMDEYDRFTITPPRTGFQSSDKRGYVPVSISEAAKSNIIYNPFNDNESNWSAAGMDAKIFAMQQQYAGKSSVMPTGPNTKPDWIVEASGGVIPRYSEGVLNALAVEYDSLQAVNTEKVRYADLQGIELRNILMQSDALINATAAGGEYCEAMSQFGIATEEASRMAERNAMFQKAYIGPTKYYEQAKEYFAGTPVTDAIGKTTKKVSDVEDAVDDSTAEYGKFGRRLDAVTDGIFATIGSLKGKAQSDLYGETATTSKSSRWYMDEFYTIEYGLGQCVSYLSDFAIMQEGVFSDVLFYPSYIGRNSGYAGAGRGGLPGYANIAELLPQNALEMKEAASRFADAADMSDANYQLSKIGETSEATKTAMEESAKELKDVSKNTRQMAEANVAMSDLYGSVYGGVGSGSGAMNAAGGFGGGYGSFFGGWYAGGAAGLSAHLGTPSAVPWMNAAAHDIGGAGAIQWAEGGFANQPTFGVFGEAGREAFVPISDRAAGRRILPQVMRELGVPMFAHGGIVGQGNVSDIIGSTSIGQITVINHANEPVDESKLAKRILEQVAKKQVLAKKRRG